MHCPRFDHFRRLNSDGTLSVCGHMVNAPKFSNLEELDRSDWLKNSKELMLTGSWPEECARCAEEESLGSNSVRLNTISRHRILESFDRDYLIVGGILDNICNSACQFCDESLSTKIGSLVHGKNYQLNNNMEKFLSLPGERIVELDISGGEPSNSPNYQRILNDPPENLRLLRMNTNASRYVDSIEDILDRNIKVTITMSLDGVNNVFEYARWPLKWSTFTDTVDRYRQLRERKSNLELNFWTTVSAYTVGNLDGINQYASDVGIDISFGLLKFPSVLDISNDNFLTRAGRGVLSGKYDSIIATREDNTGELLTYIDRQDSLRGTNYEDCYNRS